MEPVNALEGIAERVVLERKRLELSQTAFATAVGVSLSSQKRYEKGERDPDTAYLAALARIGVDIVFILTGAGSGDPYAEREGLVHVISYIQGFLRLDKGPVDLEFSQAAQASCDAYKAIWTEPDKTANADRQLAEVLRKSPVLLPDPRQLEELIEKVEFVQAARQLHLAAGDKAASLTRLYREEKESGKKVDFAVVETVLRDQAR